METFCSFVLIMKYGCSTKLLFFKFYAEGSSFAEDTSTQKKRPPLRMFTTNLYIVYKSPFANSICI